jgi:hypothetical protein
MLEEDLPQGSSADALNSSESKVEVVPYSAQRKLFMLSVEEKNSEEESL